MHDAFLAGKKSPGEDGKRDEDKQLGEVLRASCTQRECDGQTVLQRVARDISAAPLSFELTQPLRGEREET
jgi:hypothetical protein